MTEKFIAETEASNPEWLIWYYFDPVYNENNLKTQKRLLNWLNNYSKNYSLKAVVYSKDKYFGEIKWNETEIDTSKKIFFSLYQRKDYPLSK